MAKFEVRVERTSILIATVKVTKAEVCEENGLEGAEKADWQDYVQDFIDNNYDLEDLCEKSESEYDEYTIESIV